LKAPYAKDDTKLCQSTCVIFLDEHSEKKFMIIERTKLKPGSHIIRTNSDQSSKKMKS